MPAGRLSHPKIRSEDDPVTLIIVGPVARQRTARCGTHVSPDADDAFSAAFGRDCAQNASYTEEIRALIQRSHLQDAVIVHGSMPQQALFELLPQCDLYLSASSYESYSMATAEAVAHGLPVLAYATGAIGDWIEDGVNGRLIDLGQPEQFFQALRRLLTSVLYSISYGTMPGRAPQT